MSHDELIHPAFDDERIAESEAKNKFIEEQLQERDADYVRLEKQNQQLREALEKLARLGNEPHYGNSRGNEIARAALAATEKKA